MSALSIKNIITMLILGFAVGPLSAQDLRFLIPDGAIVQHAGSIGYFSGGVSYNLFKKQNGSLDIMFGIMPNSKGGGFNTLNTKFAFRPFDIKINDWLVLHPVNPGAFLSYTLGKEFDLGWSRDQYPGGYYYWSEALHLHISIGSEAKINLNSLLSSKKIRALTVYYEVNTNEMYLVNYFQNTKTLSITDIFKAGVGIKASF